MTKEKEITQTKQDLMWEFVGLYLELLENIPILYEDKAFLRLYQPLTDYVHHKNFDSQKGDIIDTYVIITQEKTPC